jgi:hypothetical protein
VKERLEEILGLTQGFADLGDVMAELFIGLARIPGGALGLDNGEHLAGRLIQAIVGLTVPGLRVITIDGNFKTDLRFVVEPPFSLPELRVDQPNARLVFVRDWNLTTEKYQGTS